jgi:hypothetical protein
VKVAGCYQKLAAHFTVYESKTVFYELLVAFLDLLFEQDILDFKNILQ